MRIISALLSFVANAIIALGDAVIFVVTLPLRIVKPVIQKVKISKRLSGTFNIKRPTPKIRAPRIKTPSIKVKAPHVKVPSVKVKLPNLSFLLFPFALLGRVLWAIVKFPAKLFRRDHRPIKITKRKPQFKNGYYYRPGFFYKLKFVFVGFIFSFIFLFLPLVSFLFVSDLPDPSNLSVNYIPKTTKIYDRNDTLLYEIYANQNRTIVKLEEVPKTLRQATIAIEDRDFYSHPGFDLRGIIRAAVTNIQRRGFQGGSTITQQLIKSAFLTPDPTIIRKIKEVALAFWAERVYTKDQILALYLNYVPYGGTAWGAQAASNIYFGKNVSDLDLAESAFLAGLPQSPSTYSPFFNAGDAWKVRQKEVLDAMLKQGYINRKERDAAFKEELTFKNPDVPLRAPHFVMYVRNWLIEKYGISEVERGGLVVKTTLDLPTQEEAQKIVTDEVEADSYLNIGNGAALVTTPSTGDIIAMVGSRNYFDNERDGNVNLTTSLRQPGSSIKLITYALALSKGYTEATILDDTPLTIPGVNGSPSYTPVNYDGAFHGRIPLRTAFANSFNLPPVRLAQKFGPATVKDFGEKMGIASWRGVNNYGVSITLGGVDTRMTELATAYGSVANGGRKVNLDPILSIKDSNGRVVYKKTPVGVEVLSPGVAFIISDILADNNARSIEFGLNTPLKIDGSKVSVKTGTTDNKRDNWTVGYTPDVLVATWVGNNDNSPMNPALASGITGAAPIWHNLMVMMIGKVGTPSAAIVPDDVVKKYCVGMQRYFVAGTQNTVNCGASFGTPTPSPQVQ